MTGSHRANLRILIVDSIPTTRRVVKTLFRQSGYRTFVEAGDTDTALDALKNGDIDLIVSDSLEDDAGLLLLKGVQKHPQYRDIPFLMVTSDSKEESVARTVKGSRVNLIVKPFTGKALSEKIDSLLASGDKKKAG